MVFTSGVRMLLLTLALQVGMLSPCGFCGRSGISACTELYLTAAKNPQARSDCEYYHDFRYKLSLTSTHTTPCTNTPVLCPVPGCTKKTGKLLSAVWKYNLPDHVRTQHPGYSVDGFQEGTIDIGLLRLIDISYEEETALHIPPNLIPTLKRTDLLAPEHPAITAAPPILHSPPAQSPSLGDKRDGHDTEIVAGSDVPVAPMYV